MTKTTASFKYNICIYLSIKSNTITYLMYFYIIMLVITYKYFFKIFYIDIYITRDDKWTGHKKFEQLLVSLYRIENCVSNCVGIFPDQPSFLTNC